MVVTPEKGEVLARAIELALAADEGFGLVNEHTRTVLRELRDEARAAAEAPTRLVLTRREGQAVVIGGLIRVTVAEVDRGHVKLAVGAPRCVQVWRAELADAMRAVVR